MYAVSTHTSTCEHLLRWKVVAISLRNVRDRRGHKTAEGADGPDIARGGGGDVARPLISHSRSGQVADPHTHWSITCKSSKR